MSGSDLNFPHLDGKKVLVTGGTGFVGRHLLPRLLDAGAHVTCLTRVSSRTSHLPDGIETVQADLRGGAGLDQALAGQEVIIHLAALLFGLSWQDFLQANALAAFSIAEALSRLKAAGEPEPAVLCWSPAWRPAAPLPRRRALRTQRRPRRFQPTAGQSC